MAWARVQTSAALPLDRWARGRCLLPFHWGRDVATHESSLTSLLLLEEGIEPMGCLSKWTRDAALLHWHWIHALLLLNDGHELYGWSVTDFDTWHELLATCCCLAIGDKLLQLEDRHEHA